MSLTLGELCDKLCIVNIKIYNMVEKTYDNTITDEERVALEENMRIMNEQRRDLIHDIDTYIEDVISGKRIHKLYPRIKSYKDFLKK